MASPFYEAMFTQRHGDNPSPVNALARVLRRVMWKMPETTVWTEHEKDMMWDSMLIGISCQRSHPFSWILNLERLCPELYPSEVDVSVAALWLGWAKVYDVSVERLAQMVYAWADENPLDLLPVVGDT